MSTSRLQTTRPPASNGHREADLRPASSAPLPAEAIEYTIRHTTLRGVGFIGMLGIALIHLLDVLSKFEETPYLGVMYIALMVASLAVAALILHSGSMLAWGAAVRSPPPR